ncbi:MAG: EthD family reductase [Gemmatimonadaceae bacterium]|nr:EthD family reductase [Acetobacteraceae bacterium]
MLVVAVMYPGADGAPFDHDYYLASHMPLVRRLWEPLGLRSTQVMRGLPAPDGATPAYVVTTLLTFDTMDSFKQAAAQHGTEIFADIPKFSGAAPALLFNETVG